MGPPLRLRVKRLLPSELIQVARETALTVEEEVSRRLRSRLIDTVVVRVTIDDEWPYEVEVEAEVLCKHDVVELREIVDEALDAAFRRLSELMRERGLEASA